MPAENHDGLASKHGVDSDVNLAELDVLAPRGFSCRFHFFATKAQAMTLLLRTKPTKCIILKQVIIYTHEKTIFTIHSMHTYREESTSLFFFSMGIDGRKIKLFFLSPSNNTGKKLI